MSSLPLFFGRVIRYRGMRGKYVRIFGGKCVTAMSLVCFFSGKFYCIAGINCIFTLLMLLFFLGKLST